MRRSIQTVVVVTATVLALTTSSAARADEGSSPSLSPAGSSAQAFETIDVVTMRDGRTLRGRVSELVPGDHVTIIVGAGSDSDVPMVLPWAEIDRVVVGTKQAAPPPSSKTPPPMAGPLVRVHIVSSGTVYLHRRAAGGTDFYQACESPCDKEFPIGDTYKIGGSGITTTHEFRIEGAPGQTVELDVDGPSWFGIVGGGLLTAIGGLSAYVGLLVAAGGGRNDDAATVGLGALLVGGALLGVGLAIVFPSMKTDLTQRVRKQKDAFVRAPSWRSIAVDVPRPPSTVLFEHRF